MNNDRFSDLAMKFCARKCSDAEQAELNSLLAARPELKVELDKLQADARLAREVLPLLAAAESSAGEFPAYARERLQTKVRQTLGRGEPVRAKPGWNWRWVLGLAVGGAAVILLLLPGLGGRGEPIIQVALLDTAGPVRGADADLGLLKGQWKNAGVQAFDQASQLEAWEASWPGGARVAAKVVYDRAAGEVRVVLRAPRERHTRTFPVGRDLAAALRQAGEFIRAETPK